MARLTTRTIKKKPPTLKQEADQFIKDKNSTTPEFPLSSLRSLIAASVLSGILSNGTPRTMSNQRIMEEAFWWADQMLDYTKK
tara:strand:- start:115 stop:363 length:249 start_codon:yes stop_codon:yes gene_type:complete